MTSYILYYAILQINQHQQPSSVTAYRLTYGGSPSVDFKEEGQDDMEGLRAGRRTIGQVAGHEINLEIEGVQDKNKIKIK